MRNFIAISCFLVSLLSGRVSVAQPMQEKALTAIVFLSVDCPISQKYVGELIRIDSLFSSKVSIKGILPGNVKKEEVDNFIQEYRIDFPITVDRDFLWVKKYKATATPEVFLLNNNDHVYYQGAIDNWFFDLGKYRQQITEHYLIDAINAVLEGHEPAISHTESVGCIIQQPSSKKSSGKRPG